MGLGFALIAVGAVLAFAFSGDILGVDVGVLGFILTIAGASRLECSAFSARDDSGHVADHARCLLGGTGKSVVAAHGPQRGT